MKEEINISFFHIKLLLPNTVTLFWVLTGGTRKCCKFCNGKT